MRVRIDVICTAEDGSEERRELFALTRERLTMETLGLALAESQALLRNLQTYLVERQAQDYLNQHHVCLKCGRRHTTKGQGTRTVNTLFGLVRVPNPRWFRCVCQPCDRETFRPTTGWVQGSTSPELLYLETK